MDVDLLPSNIIKTNEKQFSWNKKYKDKLIDILDVEICTEKCSKWSSIRRLKTLNYDSLISKSYFSKSVEMMIKVSLTILNLFIVTPTYKIDTACKHIIDRNWISLKTQS